MKTIRVRPVRIHGRCPAGLGLDDEFEIEGMRLENPKGSRICFLAVSQMPVGQGVWQLQSEERFFSHVSCPGCIRGLEHENRVAFLLGHVDRWRLCRLISQYPQLSKDSGESEAARRLAQEAIAHQQRGEHDEAARKTELALQELRRGPGERR